MSSKPDIASLLSDVDKLADLPRRDIKAMAAAGTYLHLPAAWSLMAANTSADKAYVIVSGEVSIRRHGESIATVGPGGIIGEVGIMEHRLRTAAVVSMTELQVVHFTNEALGKLVTDFPAIEAALRATAQEHLGADEGPEASDDV